MDGIWGLVRWYDCLSVWKWTYHGLSSCGGRSSVLPLVESEWWQDRSSCQPSSQWLNSCGGRTNPHIKSPPNNWVRVVAVQHRSNFWVMWWYDKLEMICNLTTSTFSVTFPLVSKMDCLFCGIEPRYDRNWTESDGGRFHINHFSPLWHSTVQQFASVLQQKLKKNDEPGHQVPRCQPHHTARR